MSSSSNDTNTGHSGSALCSAEEFTSQSFDYVVVGGGTAGLCVAARLTENPDVKVGVIEAGANRMDDKLISTPSMYPSLIGRKEYDWCMTSVPQVRNLPFKRYPISS
jgi:choline dehydrogenase-like flavoprotein